jgi:hypothetical protein
VRRALAWGLRWCADRLERHPTRIDGAHASKLRELDALLPPIVADVPLTCTGWRTGAMPPWLGLYL